MNLKKTKFYKKYIEKRPTRLILFMYLAVILVGTILLILPISSKDRVFTRPLDAAFTAVSATCVTGLVTLTSAVHWSAFGKIVIITLIQLGGLGVMTAASFISILLNKRFTLSDRLHLSEERNAMSISGIIRMVKFVLVSTFLLEGIGAIFLSFSFIPEFGLGKGIAYSIFHSISAYCNAGFDIIGNDSLAPYATNVNVSLVVSFLIILAGLGYPVFIDLKENKFNYKKYKLHTKLVLIITTILLVVPTVLFIAIEYNNPQTLGEYSFFNKILVAFFQSTTLRTAGFYTSPQALYMNASAVLMVLLMFIGGSPAGTAGGFKTTSFLSLFIITKSNVKQDKEFNIFNKRLPKDTGLKVTSIFTISMAWIVTAIFLVSLVETNMSNLDIIYEVISAYGTVGLTRGITPNLHGFSKLVIMATMLFGKIGPLSIIVALSRKNPSKSYKLQEENILIG